MVEKRDKRNQLIRNSTAEFLIFTCQAGEQSISVGYRVNSVRPTQFRQWATRVLREFAIKGYIMDKKRMESGALMNDNYLREAIHPAPRPRIHWRANSPRASIPRSTASVKGAPQPMRI